MALVREAEGVLLGVSRLLGLLKNVMGRSTLVCDRHCLSRDDTTLIALLPLFARFTAAYQDIFISIIICFAFVVCHVDILPKFGSSTILLIDEVGEISFEFEGVQLPQVWHPFLDSLLR